MGARRQHTHDTFGVAGERKGSTCNGVNGQANRAFFALHAQLPTVGVLHSDLFLRLKFKCHGVFSLVEGRKSNKLFKRSGSRMFSVIM